MISHHNRSTLEQTLLDLWQQKQAVFDKLQAYPCAIAQGLLATSASQAYVENLLCIRAPIT